MTNKQKLRHLILCKAAADGLITLPAEITGTVIDGLYGELTEEDLHWDYESELREGDVETGLPCPISRHYEAKAVAAKLPDGTWIGWTYWYGGGKHGEPGAIDWMNDAYPVSRIEEEKLVVVQTFTKAPA